MKSTETITRRLAVTLSCAVIAASSSAVTASSGYALDSAGKVVTSDFGECIQTGAWSPDLSTPECDPALAARLEAERLAAEKARRAADLAALERHSPEPTLVRLSDKRNVMFEFNSAELTAAATTELERALGTIREFDDIDAISIVGHTDSTGPESYNLALSERRAASVRRFLESRGIRASLLSASGKGEANPVADNNSREGRARNRRVDILISGNIVE